ncbi:substrate-binding periplasmic protein [Kordiimonas gwangyangensis]|uniref:substrate-binding periplasmic protein n=1 Tax=Kordiimonas gwangyangensis TaxID=288022 RepID=UPI000375B43D|nr:transporter substrate-binding domain-containing protein [Kordiimonas gwangyangensis]
MLRNTAKTIMIALCLGGVLSPAASAQPENESVKTLRLATREFIPPYVYENADSGIEVDLVTAIFRDMPFDVEFVQLPRIRMISSFEDNQLDGILTQNVTASTTGCPTEWYIEHQNVGLSVKGRGVQINSLDDLKNYAVISFSGATRYLGEDFRNAVRGAKRYTESGDQGAHISLLYKGRFDVVVGDNWIMRLAQKRYFDATGERMDLVTHPIMPPSQYVARFHDQSVCDAFNTALKNLHENGTYAEIWAGYRARIYVEAGLDSNQPH